MPILSGSDIQVRIANGELILHPQIDDASGMAVVEAASYDLRAGIVLWKELGSKSLKVVHFEPDKPYQESVTLLPGQMVFVITHEELSLPHDICGTVYSRNRLQKENILALNAGHVDPGFTGPIIIRLINLSQTPWTLSLGEAVFTAVFHSVKIGPEDRKRDIRTKSATLLAAQKTADEAFSNPLHDLYTAELNRHFAAYEQQLETRIRRDLTDEFFLKDNVYQLAFAMVLALLTLIVLIVKVPWGDIFSWLESQAVR